MDVLISFLYKPCFGIISAVIRRGLILCCAFTVFLLALMCSAKPAFAQEMLLNRSFESPVVPNNGNNFYATLPNWAFTNISPANANPVNLIRPFAGYTGNPTATPTGGGIQYLDINSARGSVSQTVTFPRDGNIDFSAWFSVRDNQQALTNSINIRNSSGTVIASTSASHLASDPIGLWRQASAVNVAVSAGSYTFELVMADPSNTDLASLIFKPGLTTTKTSVVFSDPVSITNPKAIPGSFIDYTIGLSNPAAIGGANPVPGYTVTSGSVIVSDATPANMEMFVGDLGGAGTGPAVFNAGTSGLSYTYTNLASATDNIEFSNNNGTSWTYTPVPDAAGFDAAVTNVRMRPTGAMAAGTNFSFRLRYRVS
jgi:hypothetical protein